MDDVTIRQLESRREWREAFPVVEQLRTHLDEASYLAAMDELTTDGYRLFAALKDDEVVALAGVRTRLNLYYGRHVWVDELVTDVDHRSSGYGSALLGAVTDWASDRGCETVALSSGLEREEAHRFYEGRMGMDRSSYVFKTVLE